MSDKITIPELPLAGGCQCGSVRYKLAGRPVVFYICHCTECQKQASSAFGQSVRVNSADLSVSGRRHTFERSTASGNKVVCEFCPECGSRLFHRRDTYSDTLNIKAGTLDDTRWLKPAGHIWTKSKQSWVHVPKGVLTYPGQPENYDALITRWQELTASS